MVREETMTESEVKEMLELELLRLLRTKSGRYFLSNLIFWLCGKDERILYDTPENTAYACGRRDIGVHLYNRIKNLNPDLLSKMVAEHSYIKIKHNKKTEG